MALGTITQVTNDPHGLNVPVVLGDLKVTVSTVVGDGAYASGGTALTAAQLGLPSKILFTVCTVAGSAANNGAIQASYNTSTGKLQCWASSGTSPVGLVEAGSVNLSGLTITVVAFGF